MPERTERSDQHRDEPKGPKGSLEQLIDLTVFAPIGLLMSLDEVLPQLVEKGHQHVKVARYFGRMAVRTGGEEARKRFADTAAPAAGLPGDERATVVPIRPVPAPVARSSRRRRRARRAGAVPAASLGIPDYDALSASQVVPRLDGLARRARRRPPLRGRQPGPQDDPVQDRPAADPDRSKLPGRPCAADAERDRGPARRRPPPRSSPPSAAGAMWAAQRPGAGFDVLRPRRPAQLVLVGAIDGTVVGYALVHA